MRWLARLVVALVVFAVTSEVVARVALTSRGFLYSIAADTQAGRKLASLATMAQGGPQLFGIVGVGPDAELGWAGREGRSVEGAMPVTVDADGRRITAPVGDQADSTALDVAVVGDSFTFGDEVGDADTYAWKLRALTGADVQNHGMVGYGLDQILLQWRRDLAPDPPDVLIVGFNTVVMMRVGRDFDSWAKPSFRLADGELVLQGVPVPPAESLRLKPWTPRLPYLLDVYAERLSGTTRDLSTVAPLADAIFRQLVAEVGEAGTRLVLARLPMNTDFERPQLGGPLSVEAEIYRAWCGRLEVTCVDLFPPFIAAHADGAALAGLAHWTPAGHTLAASELADAL